MSKVSHALYAKIYKKNCNNYANPVTQAVSTKFSAAERSGPDAGRGDAVYVCNLNKLFICKVLFMFEVTATF